MIHQGQTFLFYMDKASLENPYPADSNPERALTKHTMTDTAHSYPDLISVVKEKRTDGKAPGDMLIFIYRKSEAEMLYCCF